MEAVHGGGAACGGNSGSGPGEFSTATESEKPALLEELNRKAREKWKRLLLYGMERGEFRKADPEQMTDLILYAYQGVRLWSRVIPLGEKTGKHIVEQIRKDLVDK